jgi:hypothetical protein
MAPTQFRVLIAGGGVAALEAVLTLQELDEDRSLHVEVIAPESRFVYRPLSVRDPFGPRATRSYELRPLVEGAGAELRHGQIDAVEPDERFVTLGDGTRLDYDALLLATGVLRQPAIRGVSTFAGPADAPAFKSFVDALRRGAYRRAAFIIPPGPTWPLPMYELALQAATRLRCLSPQSREGIQMARSATRSLRAGRDRARSGRAPPGLSAAASAGCARDGTPPCAPRGTAAGRSRRSCVRARSGAGSRPRAR